MPNFNGLWTSRQQMQARGGNTWPSVPGATTSPVATAGNASASVAFTAPADTGFPANAITGYRVTSTPGGFTGTGLTSPVTVSGLTNGTAYTFTVAAQNVNGYGPESAASNSVTPVLPSYVEDVFSTWLYTGNSSTQTITNGIDLAGKGGLVIGKIRNTAGGPFQWYDTVRGVTKVLESSSSAAQTTVSTGVTAYNSNGFTIGSNSNVNLSPYNYASWVFREQAKFFDIVTFTTDGSKPPNTGNISHNLGSTPACVMIKSTSGSQDWKVYHVGLDGGGFYAINRYLQLNDTTAPTASTNWINVSSTTISFPGSALDAGVDYVAYLFASNAGGFGLTGSDNVISCGSFTTDGSGNATVSLGYEPQWVMIKNSSSTGYSWIVTDDLRGMVTWNNGVLYSRQLTANTTNAEENSTVGPTSTGFTVNNTATSNNFIYIAVRRGPMAVPTDGTKVFAPAKVVSASAGTVQTTGFRVDMSLMSYNSQGIVGAAADRLRGVPIANSGYQTLLFTPSSSAESTADYGPFTYNYWNTGFTYGANGNASGGFTTWNFQRAPGFFDEVVFKATGSAQNLTHNLGVAPEMMILKDRTSAQGWYIATNFTASTYTGLYFATSAGTTGGYDNYINAQPTSSVFRIGANFGAVNDSIVNYLFATCAGISKVGSYTGTGATQTIACGFAAGARFVLIKRTDSTGDWYVWDTVRGMVSGTDPSLLLNSNAAEVNANSIYTITTGFQIVSTAAGINASGGTYIFLAIA